MPAEMKTFDLLIRNYCDRGTAAEVNYWKFCKDLDKPEDIFPGYTPKHAPKNRHYFPGVTSDIKSPFFQQATTDIDVIKPRWEAPRVDIFCDPSDIEDRLRAAVVMKRVRIEQFFQDYDKLRKGYVTKAQFNSILSMLNFRFTQNEYDALAQKYETSHPEKFFNYVAFSESINKAFTTKGIDKAPTVKVPAVNSNDTLLARRKYLQDSGSSSKEQIN